MHLENFGNHYFLLSGTDIEAKEVFDIITFMSPFC